MRRLAYGVLGMPFKSHVELVESVEMEADGAARFLEGEEAWGTTMNAF